MRLTVHTDYALRTLIYLAVLPDRLGTIHEVATAYGISENHLTKVVHRLGQLGYVETVRGRRGGIRLARAPADIQIGAVVRDTEDDFALVDCGGPGSSAGPCRLLGGCVLQGALAEALSAFMSVLDRYTLADLAHPRDDMARRLLLPEPAEAVE